MSARRQEWQEEEQTAQPVPDCSQEEDASFPEDYAIISYEDMPQEEEEDSPSPEVYMKRIKWLSFFANLACHLAVWICLLSCIVFPYLVLTESDFFPSIGALGLCWLICSVVVPLALGFANMIMANIIMVNIRKYCYLVYSDENIRIQEIRQLVLEYIGLTSSHFIISYFSIR